MASPAPSAKFSCSTFFPSEGMKVSTPTARPHASTSGPPLFPDEMLAECATSRAAPPAGMAITVPRVTAV
jgi:hypothetical protein